MTVTLAIVRQDSANYMFHWDVPQNDSGPLRSVTGGLDQLKIETEHRNRLEALIEATVAELQLLYPSREQQKIADEKTSGRLEELGRFMFNFLLPTSLKQLLRYLPEGTALLVATNDTNLPWELLHDGDNFLALKYAFGRQLLTPTPPNHQRNLEKQNERPFLFITNPTGELGEADKEAQKLIDLCDRAPGNIAARQISHSRANKTVVLQAFGSGTNDFIHYSGHATPNGLSLADGLLDFAEIIQVLSGRPCIFLNGCQSAAMEKNARILPFSGLNVQNLATAFVMHGARLFIGALWDVFDVSSREFAEKFYALILNGVAIGEALRQSRKALHTARPNDPLWASYILYGDPTEQIVSVSQPETRAMTMMDVKVVGLHNLFDHFDIERGSALQAQIEREITSAIVQYEGTVLRWFSHHLCAAFGLADTYGDSPTRAMRAAQEVMTVVEKINDRYQSQLPIRLQAHVGISSGQVLKQMQNQTIELSGKPVAAAAQLADLAAAGEILTDAATYRFTRSAFHFAPIPPNNVSEHTKFDDIYLAGAEIAIETTSEKLVGRQYELEQLQMWWQEATRGAGHLVSIVGQAGIGKTRLVQAFQNSLVGQNKQWLTAVCQTYNAATSYALLAQLIRRLASIRPEDEVEKSQRQLANVVQLILTGNAADSARQHREGIALLGQVISLDVSDPVIDSLDPELRQRRLAALLQAILAYKSQQSPLVIILEDLHWADEASLAVLEQIIARLERRRILLVAIFRPDWQVPWGHWAHARQLYLQELSAEEQLEILQSLLKTTELPAGLSETILARTGGNPFFIEETLTVLQESKTLAFQAGTWALNSEAATKLLPDKVEQMILARVQRLSESDRELLHTAVVIGQEFDYALLDTILPDQVQNRLDLGLDELTARELIYTAAGWLPPQITYAFKHGLIQQIIYSDLLDSFRRRVHRQVAQALKNLYHSQEGQVIEQIAYHAYRGDDRVLAITSCLQAAIRATEVWANQTAVAWYDHVFAKLETFNQVPPLEAEVENGCTENQINQWHVSTLIGKADVQLLIGEYEAAVIDYNKAVAVSKETASFTNTFRADLYRKIADAYQEQGDYAAAEQALETGLSIVANGRNLETGKLYVWQGLLAFRRGLLVDGLNACHKGIEIIKEIGNVRELARAYNLEGLLYRNMGRSDEAMRAHEQSIALYQESSYMPGLERAYSNLGCVYQDVSRWDVALNYFQKSADLSERTGEIWRRVAAAINLAEIFKLQGKFEEALAYNRKAQDLALTHELSELVGITLLNLGTIYLKLTDLSKAAENLEKCQQLFAELGTETYLVETLCSLAKLRILEEEPEAGLAFGQAALAAAEQQERLLALGTVNRVLGQAYRALQQRQKAEAYLVSSLDILEKQNTPYEQGLTLAELARLYRDENERQKAAACCDRAITIFEALGAGHDLVVTQKLKESIA